jgi:hypothetical protein
MLRRALSSVTRTLALQRRSWNASNAGRTGLVRGVRGGRVEALSGARLASLGGGVHEARRTGKLGSVSVYTRDIQTIRMHASKHDPSPLEGAHSLSVNLGFGCSSARRDPETTRADDERRLRPRSCPNNPFAVLDRRTANECA